MRKSTETEISTQYSVKPFDLKLNEYCDDRELVNFRADLQKTGENYNKFMIKNGDKIKTLQSSYLEAVKNKKGVSKLKSDLNKILKQKNLLKEELEYKSELYQECLLVRMIFNKTQQGKPLPAPKRRTTNKVIPENLKEIHQQLTAINFGTLNDAADVYLEELEMILEEEEYKKEKKKVKDYLLLVNSFGLKQKCKQKGIKLSYMRNGKRVYRSQKTLEKMLKGKN